MYYFNLIEIQKMTQYCLSLKKIMSSDRLIRHLQDLLYFPD